MWSKNSGHWLLCWPCWRHSWIFPWSEKGRWGNGNPGGSFYLHTDKPCHTTISHVRVLGMLSLWSRERASFHQEQYRSTAIHVSKSSPLHREYPNSFPGSRKPYLALPTSPPTCPLPHSSSGTGLTFCSLNKVNSSTPLQGALSFMGCPLLNSSRGWLILALLFSAQKVTFSRRLALITPVKISKNSSLLIVFHHLIYFIHNFIIISNHLIVYLATICLHQARFLFTMFTEHSPGVGAELLLSKCTVLMNINWVWAVRALVISPYWQLRYKREDTGFRNFSLCDH